MFELIGLGVAGAAGVLGHIKSKQFVKKRLRFTTVVDKPGIGIAAGAAAALVAAPVVALLPVVGAGTAIVFGAGVGTGVAMGAKAIRERRLED